MSVYPIKTYLMPVIVSVGVFIAANVLLYVLIYRPSFSLPVTASNAPADARASEPPAVQPPAADWMRENGIVIQQADLAQDMLYGTGIIAEQFTASVVITLPAGSTTAGGGLVFHMPGRDSRENAHMVRLADGGRYLMWGTYDSAGTFQSEGGAAIENPTAQMTLTLQVRPTGYSILINDVIMAQDIALQQAGGYLGYISYGGPVTFSDLIVSLSL